MTALVTVGLTTILTDMVVRAAISIRSKEDTFANKSFLIGVVVSLLTVLSWFVTYDVIEMSENQLPAVLEASSDQN